MNDAEAAADVWSELHRDGGGDTRSFGALDRLLGSLGRWRELADLLRARESGHAETVARLHRCAEILRNELDDGLGSIEVYGEVLELEPRHDAAIEAVHALVDRTDAHAAAVELLARVYKRVGNPAGLYSLLEARVALEQNARRRAGLLRESAEHVSDEEKPGEAVRLLCRALVFDGVDVHLEQQLMRAAEAAGSWDEVARALVDAADGVDESQVLRRGQLLHRAATMFEQRLGETSTPQALFGRVIEEDGEAVQALNGWLRTSVDTERWRDAARAAWRLSVVQGMLTDDLRRASMPEKTARLGERSRRLSRRVTATRVLYTIGFEASGAWCWRVGTTSD